MFINKKKRTWYFEDFIVQDDHEGKLKESEKIDKYMKN